MTDHSQLVKLNDLARDIPRMIDNASTSSQNTSLVDDAVTREAITLKVATPFLVAVSERDELIDALQGRVVELEAGLRGMLTRHSAAKQNWEQAAVDAQRAGDFALRDRITNTALQALTGFPVTEARALLERKPS